MKKQRGYPKRVEVRGASSGLTVHLIAGEDSLPPQEKFVLLRVHSWLRVSAQKKPGPSRTPALEKGSEIYAKM